MIMPPAAVERWHRWHGGAGWLHKSMEGLLLALTASIHHDVKSKQAPESITPMPATPCSRRLLAAHPPS